VTDALVISAGNAAMRGMTLYFNGKPCAQGHIGPRRVSDRACCECHRLRQKGTPGRPRVFAAELIGRDIRELPHVSWPNNGRVEVVTDPNWLIDGKPRVVRKIGWRACMCCKRRFFSQDMTKIRICDPCKASKVDKTAFGVD